MQIHIDQVKEDHLSALFQELTLIIHRKGWARITAKDVYFSMVKLSGEELYIKSKDDLLTFLIETAEKRVLPLKAKIDERTAVNDILLEGIMSFLDGLLPFKDFLSAVFLSHLRSAVSLQLLSRIESVMQIVLEMAHVKTSSLKGVFRVKALALIFINVFHAWLQDNTPEQGQVLALLDSRLAQAEEFAGYLGV